MDKIQDGLYEIPFEAEMDKGYGVEGISDTLSIIVRDGEFDDITLHGMHDVMETEFEMAYLISDEEAFRILEAHLGRSK